MFFSNKSYLQPKVFCLSKSLWFLFLLMLVLFNSCNKKKKASPEPIKNIGATYLSLKYAKGFEINYFKGCKQIIVKQPWKNSKEAINYYLVEDSAYIPKNISTKDIILFGKIDKVALLSTTYLSFIEQLHLEKYISAISDHKYVYSSVILDLFKQNKITEVGFDENLDYEKLLLSKTQLLFTYAINQPKDESKLKKFGINRVIVSEYLEKDPLAQAEWLLFFAAFFNEEEKAQAIFDGIDKNYQTLKLEVDKLSDKPTVMCNLPFKGNWFVPGGKSVVAQFIKDACGKYIFEENLESGGVNLPYETALTKAMEADYFIHVNNCKSKKELINDFNAIKNCKAFKNNKIYNNNLLTNDLNANDFWESGIAYPDRVLADLIHILHPDFNKNYSLKYYRKIE